MEFKKLRNTLGLAVTMALMVGCAGTSTDDSGTTGAATDAGTSSAAQPSYDQAAADAAALASLQRVFYFDLVQSSLRPEVTAQLDRYVALLKSGSQSLRREGHADERGTTEYNLALGERRAKAVADYLSVNGISPSRVETISYGEERPAAAGHDEESWALNRRVELILN
jgi:peptidoglycan-associated lipoprotein